MITFTDTKECSTKSNTCSRQKLRHARNIKDFRVLTKSLDAKPTAHTTPKAFPLDQEQDSRLLPPPTQRWTDGVS